MKAQAKTLTEAANQIQRVTFELIGTVRSDKAFYLGIARAAKQVSKNPVFNVAAYLKFNFGSNLSGMTNQDWLDTAKTLIRILK